MNPKAAASAGASKRPFVVDVQAAFLKRNADLSKGARNLYGTMRSLADGKTGELAIQGTPLDWKYVSRQAEMGRDKWQACLKELRLARLVRVERQRVMRFTGGRKRVVLGRALYVVLRAPVNGEIVKNRPNLLMPDFSTVEEHGTQVFQTLLKGAAVPAVESDVLESESGEQTDKSSSAPVRKTDDDCARSLFHIETIQCEAKKVLLGRGESPEFVDEAIALIDERSHAHETFPASARYYLKAFEVLNENRVEVVELWEKIDRKKALREKWMPGFDATKFSSEPDESLTKIIRDALPTILAHEVVLPAPDDNLATFEKFWEPYPRKIDQDAAKKLWRKMSPNERFLAIDSLPRWVRAWQISERDPQYIPLPTTFLRKRRWESEPI